MACGKKCSIAVFVLGAIFLIFGFILGYVIFPAVVDTLIKEELDIWKKDSEGRKNFEEPPVPVYMNFYFYHVLNPDNITAGTEKPRLEERGPYAYREDRHKIDVSNKSLSECFIQAGQYKAYYFDESKSCENCKANDSITMINAPLIGFVSVIKSKSSFIPWIPNINRVINNGCIKVNCTGDPLFNEDYKDSLFIETNVDEFIFGGYKHGVIRYVIEQKWLLFGEQMPPQIREENGFAVFNGKNDTAYNEYYELYTSYCQFDPNDETIFESEYDLSDMKQYMEIRRWGPSVKELQPDLNKTSWWKIGGGFNGSNACNKIEGTDGQQFHPDVKEDEKLWIFSTDLCRSMFITFQDNADVEGIPVLQFAPPVEALQVNTVENVGFCMQVETKVDWDACIETTDDPNFLDLTECYKDPGYQGTCLDGTLNITSCQKDAPVIISSPHFYQNPDFLRTKFDGISPPEPDKHETRLYIEPTTGMTIKLNKRIQINIPLLNETKIDILKNVKNIELFPMVWVDESADIDEANVEKLKKMVVMPTRAVIGIQWTLVAVGALMMLGSVILFCVRRKH